MIQLGFTRLGTPSGRPLVIIHGWGCDSRFLLPLANLFPERDVYLIDLPGYGKSANFASVVTDFTASTDLLLNTIPDDSDVMSWSFGSLYALRALSVIKNPCVNMYSLHLNTLHNEHVQKSIGKKDCQQEVDNKDQFLNHNAPHIRSLVTICGTPRFPSDPNWPGIRPDRVLKCNTELNERRMYFLLSFFYRMQISDHGEKSEEGKYLKKIINKQDMASLDVLRAGINLVSYLDERPAFYNLKVPALHLFGAQDPLVPVACAKYQHQEPLHKTHIFPYSSHNPYLSEPLAFKTVVNKFYEDVDLLTKPLFSHPLWSLKKDKTTGND